MSAAMPTDPPKPPVQGVAEQPGKRPLTPAAERALAEAAARRAERAPQNAGSQKEAQKEAGGRGGLEPTRYGDWEINGLISDF
jgi:hypothetical protein